MVTSIGDWPAPGDLVRVGCTTATLCQSIRINGEWETWDWPRVIPAADVQSRTPMFVVAVTKEKFWRGARPPPDGGSGGTWSAIYVLTPYAIGWVGEDALGDPHALEPRGGEHE